MKYEVVVNREETITFIFELEDEQDECEDDDVRDAAAQYAYESFLGDEWFNVDFYVASCKKIDD